MAPRNIVLIVNTIGALLLGLAYYPLKAATTGWMLIAIILIYAIALNLASYLIAKRFGKNAGHGADSDA